VETFNCIFSLSGSVERRPGFEEENGSDPLTVSRTGNVITNYLWKDAGGTGNIAVVVQQIGATLRFYDTTTALSISGGLSSNTVSLSTYLPAGGDSTKIPLNECQFSAGNGYLFVTHPFLNPFYVKYDPATTTFTATQIDLKVRDFEGETTDTNFDNGTRPSTLSNAHKYNLLNQGWTNEDITTFYGGWQGASGTWTSGSNQLTGMSQQAASSLVPGMVCVSGGPTAWASATITQTEPHAPASASGNDNVSLVKMSANAGASSSGVVFFAMQKYPSNFDVPYTMTNEYDIFAVSSIAAAGTPASPAPKGHYISSAYEINRNTLSGLTGLTTTTCGLARPSSTAFYAGRVWYTGINATGYNNILYFSQILDNVNKAGLCYQRQDPTNKDFSDLLPNDGGTIAVQGCGTIYKIIPSASSLLIFASNGVWEVTGNQGLSLTATDYSVNKLSNVPSLSHRSFVEIDSNILWWNANGIYGLEHSQTGTQVKSLTDGTIASFLALIPQNNKPYVRGAFNAYTRVVQWLYRTEETEEFNQNYQYDGVLNFNMLSGAFYPWTFDNTSTGINDIIALETTFGAAQVYDVADGGTLVTDSSVTVTVTSNSGNIGTPEFRYCISTPNGSDHDFTFATCSNSNYVDWPNDQNVDAPAEFVSGYRLRGEALKKFQPNWVNVYAQTPTSIYFQGIWDYATTSLSNRFSSRQIVENTDPNFLFFKKRLKVRGRGVVLVFRVQSRPGLPMTVIGWATQDIVNAAP
jgi:hypothetical protein